MGKNTGKRNVIPAIAAEVGAGDPVKGFVRWTDGSIITEAQAAHRNATAADGLARRAEVEAERQAAIAEATAIVAMFSEVPLAEVPQAERS